MRKGSLFIACLVSWACTALGGQTAYELKRDHTDITFRINHAGFSMKHGSFGDVSGILNLDADHLDASSVDVTVAIKSIATNDEKRDGDLRSSKFLDADQYPNMHFASSRVVQTGANTIDVTGTLSLHGISKPLVLHATVNRIGPSPFGNALTAGFSATGTLKRSDYGITGLIPMIGDEVDIEIDAEFVVPKANTS